MKVLMTLVFAAKMTNPSFLRGEGIYLTLELFNSGSQPVELGRPVSMGDCSCVLTTPEGERFYADKKAPLNPSIPGFEWGKSPEPSSVAPDVRWSGLLHLERLFKFKTNGRYRLEVSCSWDRVRLESPPLEFQVEDIDLLQVSRGSDGGRERGDTCLVLLRESAEGRELMYSHIDNVRDECGFRGIPKLGGPHRTVSLPKHAADPVHTSKIPSDTTFSSDFWREENTLHWHYVHNHQMPLPGAVDRLLDPALLDGRTGVNHIYALSSKEGVQRLVIARVVDYLKGQDQPERIQAEFPLEVPPRGAAAEMDLVRGRPYRSVAIGAIEGGAPRVDWMSYPGDDIPEKLQSHVWKKCPVVEAIPDARPTILHSKDGGLRVTWIACEWGRPKRGLFCDVMFGASGELQGETVTVIDAKEPILAARAVVPDLAPVVALWTEDGGVLAGAPNDLHQLERPGSRRVPPTLVIFRGDPYVLDFSPVEGLVLLPVPGFNTRD